MPRRPIGLLIVPMFVPPPPDAFQFGFAFFDIAYQLTVPDRPRLLTQRGKAREDFQQAALSAASYLRSYRQRDNGSKQPRWVVLEHLLLTSFWETIYMTRKPTAPRSPAPSGDLIFLDVRLTQEQFDELDAAKVSSNQLLAALTSAVATGLRFSFSYNAEKGTANAMLTDNRPDSPHRGKALSAFSDDCLDALRVVMYKHLHVLGGDWGNADAPTSVKRKRG